MAEVSAETSGDLNAVVPKATLWKLPSKERVLKVYYLGEQEKWRYKNVPLKPWMVMKIIKKGWSMDGVENGEYVPRFERALHEYEAHIRVEFKMEAKGGSHSKLGTKAREVRDLDEPTMVLNLNDCTDDYHIESIILHEFGHALGLGHEHQHPEYLDVMKEFFIKDRAMTDCLGITPNVLRDNYKKLNYELAKTDYDVHSIMHYPTKIGMLKEKYRHLKKPEEVDSDPTTKDLQKKQKAMLKNFLLHLDYVTNKPSEKDKSTLAQAYFEEYKKTPEYQAKVESVPQPSQPVPEAVPQPVPKPVPQPVVPKPVPQPVVPQSVYHPVQSEPAIQQVKPRQITKGSNKKRSGSSNAARNSSRTSTKIFKCLLCCCIRDRPSQLQRWGSEEDTFREQQYPPSNTYTALALDTSEFQLPPSPLSPMPSFIGIDPKWEFPRENIQLLEVLAEGQFTVLYKGVAKNLRVKPCEVAIKALKDDATEDDVKALLYEMDVLSGIEEHPNIISLIRVCTVGKPLYMVMEYMCHGDLLGFLRACRGHNGMYTVSPGNNHYQPPSLQLSSRDLLNMATKIANGMRYLANRKIVHRALCARNILVGSDIINVKIYNIGSFDISFNNNGNELIKWMAPETLFDGTNTTYSDVWSFGVTLWELVTVGGTPYGEILPEDLYAQLQSGMRMPCPTHCTQEVYGIMSACWQKNPVDRPHFAIIYENLDELVESKLNYLDLRSYDNYAYSQFDMPGPQLSTAL